MKISGLNICIQILSPFPAIYKTSNQTPVKIMEESGYPNLFSLISIENLSQYLIQNPQLIEDWLIHSDDIRHTPAWSFERNKNGKWIVSYIGRNGEMIEEYKYDDKFVACAKMIKMTFEEIKM